LKEAVLVKETRIVTIVSAMKIIMNDSHLTDVTQIAKFLKGSQGVDLSLREAAIAEKYHFISGVVRRLEYTRLVRRERRLVVAYLKKLTGYKKSQLNLLIERAAHGQLTKGLYKRVNPSRIYTACDIKLLEKTDEIHLRLAEKATQEIFRREVEVFGHKEFQTIAGVSHAHITNLRNSPVYKNSWINHTKARSIQIGITMKPQNYGSPGSIRVDAVSQRDVYHINCVDEITQWEIVFCIPRITEECMIEALPLIFDQFPFVIFNFHSDRGGENINHLVAAFLHKHLIKQTKSRSYHSNDNGLVETKNGSVIRKNMGWEHIDQNQTAAINEYYQNWFNPYLNFHRPCGYPTITIDDKGKKKKVYQIYRVPYEALKSIPGATKYLKPGISFAKLDIIAYERSDNEFAEIMRNEERRLFTKITKVTI